MPRPAITMNAGGVGLRSPNFRSVQRTKLDPGPATNG